MRTPTALNRRVLAATLSVALATAPLSAMGQAPAAAPPASAENVATARAHFARGVKLYEEDDFRGALIEFSRAYELAPNWAVLYNIGQSYYQLRDYANALKTLEKYVKEGGSRIAADRQSEVNREIEEVRGRVARVTLKTNQPDADLALDDAPMGKSPLAEPVLIGIGRHKLTASKAGFVTATKVVDVAGAESITIELPLHAEAQRSAETARPNYTAAAIAGGVGLAGIAVGTVFGVAAMSNKSSLNSECNAQKICPTSAQGNINAFSTNGLVSTIGFGVGGAGIALGLYLFIRERSKSSGDEGTQPAAAAGVRPWVGIGSAGLDGRFW
jgi:hypothetical protein